MKTKVIFLILIVLFLFTRFYNIGQSLFLYNDMGRDLLVLLKWQKFGTIPIVGPQTSALPISQSPMYYYLLFPFYLITGQSPYSALLLNAFLYLLSYAVCLYLTKSQKTLRRAVHLVFLLMVFHPQFILQSRYVWNPSLLPPIVFMSLILFFISTNSSKKMYVFYSIILAIVAASIHYSAIPLLLAYFIVIFFTHRKQWVKSVIVGLVSFIMFNLTTMVQLMKRLVATGVVFYSNQVFQVGSSFSKKMSDFVSYGLGLSQNIIGTFFVAILCVVLFFSIKQTKNKNLRYGFLIFLITFVTTFFSPFNLQAHYIFVLATVLFLCIGLLNWKMSVPIIIFLLIFYASTQNFLSYFRQAPRTYGQMNSCFKEFCQQFKEPVFVSTQSNLYPYHFGPEHRYLMLKNNCQMKEIEHDQKAADYMALVLDSGNYSDKTSFYELDLFGKHKIVKTVMCQRNFGIVLLKKSPSNGL